MPKTQMSKELGISRATIYNYFENPDFKALLEKRRQEILDCNKTKVQALADEAIDWYQTFLLKKEPTPAEMKKADNVLKFLLGTGALSESKVQETKGTLKLVLSRETEHDG